MRKVVALAVVVGLAVSMAGCSTSAPSGACVTPIKSGDASSIVSANGAFGAKTTVSFPTPLVTSGEEVTTIDAGTGPTIYNGQFADFQPTVINGKTGAVIYSPATGTAPQRFLVNAEKVGIGGLIQCATVGSRLAATMTVRDLAGSKGLAASFGLGLDDTVVLVLDVSARFLGRAAGIDQIPQAGLPTVVLAPNGQPGLTIPHTDAPTALRAETLIRGDGPKVRKGDTIVANYTVAIWDTNVVFDSNWDKTPVDLTAKPFTATDTSGVVPGFATAVIGQTVGSQILVVVPPKYGYPTSSLPTGITAKTTLVFVVDLLGIDN